MRTLLKSSLLAVSALFAGGILWNGAFLSFSPLTSLTTPAFMVALAEDDKEEEDDDEGYRTASPRETVPVWEEVIEYRPVTKKVIVTEEGYNKDTDGDSLVDALDPDPLVSQKAYFTDQDNDFVPDALDRYPGEDDFSYYESETDNNSNGILDSYEQ
jgi:hypothetical protein